MIPLKAWIISYMGREAWFILWDYLGATGLVRGTLWLHTPRMSLRFQLVFVSWMDFVVLRRCLLNLLLWLNPCVSHANVRSLVGHLDWSNKESIVDTGTLHHIHHEGSSEMAWYLHHNANLERCWFQKPPTLASLLRWWNSRLPHTRHNGGGSASRCRGASLFHLT
jgi:hypothetical protein